MKEMPGKEEIQIIHRYLSGEMGEAEKTQFEKRLAKDPELVALKEEITLIWNAAAQYQEPAFESKNAFLQFNKKIHQGRSIRRRIWLASAAAAVALLLFALWTFLLHPDAQPMQVVFADHMLHRDLEDGSVLALRKGTVIRIPEKFDRSVRKVEIVSGEVFFDIAHETDRPFIIENPWAEVRVTGTEFTIAVDTTAQTYTLKVIEGAVRFKPVLSRNAMTVKAGNGVRFYFDTRMIDPLGNIDANAASWSTGVPDIYRPPGEECAGRSGVPLRYQYLIVRSHSRDMPVYCTTAISRCAGRGHPRRPVHDIRYDYPC